MSWMDVQKQYYLNTNLIRFKVVGLLLKIKLRKHILSQWLTQCYIYWKNRYQFRCSDEGKPDSRRKVARTSSFVRTLPNQLYEIDEKGKLVDQVMWTRNKNIWVYVLIILFIIISLAFYFDRLYKIREKYMYATLYTINKHVILWIIIFEQEKEIQCNTVLIV